MRRRPIKAFFAGGLVIGMVGTFNSIVKQPDPYLVEAIAGDVIEVLTPALALVLVAWILNRFAKT
jgi:hypothetical protein